MVKTHKPAMNKMMSTWLNVRKRKEAMLAQSESDLELEETQCYQSGGTGGTTSESESEISATVKRPRFRDYKRALRSLQNLDGEAQTSISNEANCDSETEKKKDE